MAVKNNLVKAQGGAQNATTEYESNGEKIKLSPTIIRKYLVSGDGNVTEQEAMMFLMLCKSQHLNPFLREAYLIKYGNSPATMVTGKDVFLKRARRQKDFEGMEAGIVVWNADGDLEERCGTYYSKEHEELVGGWAKVYIHNFVTPIYCSVSLEEYMGRKKDGTPNSQWSLRPATMIRKVAQSQALREAFPESFGGLYAQEEMSNVSDVVLDETTVQVVEEAPRVQPEPEPMTDADYPDQTIGGALFDD